MEKVLLVAALLAGTINTIVAQSTITIGNGTGSGTYAPIASWYESSATESIYMNSEIGVTGLITKISFDKASGSSTVSPEVKIYMKMTTTSVLSADYAIGTGFNSYVLVYDGTIPNNGNGWKEVSLDTPFAYSDTSKNLAILVVGSTCIESGRPQYRYTTTANNKLSAGYDDGTIGCGGNNPWTSASIMEPVWERPNVILGLSTLGTTDNVIAEKIVIFVKNQQLIIDSKQAAIQAVSVFDLSGKQLWSKENINTNLFSAIIDQSNQVLVVRIIDSEDNITYRKVIF
ncbi:T9SS sorting signal type C domain-containing protein [Flavobacterium silvaticum]|uniref:T9SS sorting signal type C domain-containing protein n=1 Tax=Flavobacterium silvaticum TaxID=1852020 RepID=A0A972FWG4_9FLAO|nr:T9SS sorting signal type C domain-containing protein [Flavobacterium silvaticum]NMH29287.1 T9SS sorting signal type C domain-containing protein [Flavobacterium silvaticum]